EMFQGLMNNFEMAKAKGQITDRAKEIEVFQDTVNNLMGMFINSLAINQSSEERIRETLSLELNTKDKTIADLQEYKEKMKSAAKVNDEKVVELEKIVKDLTGSLEKTTKELAQKNIIVDNQQDQINTLNSIVTEYKQYRDLNKELEIVNTDLKTEITKEQHKNVDLESKLVNMENMRDFFANQIEELSGEIKELNQSIKEEVKAIENEYKEELKSTELAHKQELKELARTNKLELSNLNKELTKAFKEDLNNKLDMEKSKYQLEIDKAINKEQLLEEKYNSIKTELENIKSINNN
ncbi:MAG: hypothetical protein ACRC3Y_12420, partial [Romboutsia sp.]|uniref:hypothetical protein n=1 Tax=Romboutsia sp. TaxID=1965302 RepID=UPI003F3079C1